MDLREGGGTAVKEWEEREVVMVAGTPAEMEAGAREVEERVVGRVAEMALEERVGAKAAVWMAVEAENEEMGCGEEEVGVERGEGVQSTSPRISHDICLHPQAPGPW